MAKKKEQDTQDTALLEKIADLETKLTEQEEITKRAQSDYFRLKMELDAYTKRVEETQEQVRVDAVVKMGQKLLPFVSNLQQSVAHMPQDMTENAWVQGVALIANKSMTDLESIGIYVVLPETGEDPDLTVHMPINMQDVEDDTLKGKIVQVVEAGWKYEKDGQSQVILPAKVVVGS